MAGKLAPYFNYYLYTGERQELSSKCAARRIYSVFVLKNEIVHVFTPYFYVWFVD